MRPDRGTRPGHAAVDRRAALALGLATGASLGLGAGRAVAAGSAAEATTITRLAASAFVWGSPPVVMERTRLAALFDHPPPLRLAANRLRHFPNLLNGSSRRIVLPNADTLYSSAWLDLREGPVTLEVPALSGRTDRYYSCQLLDWFTNTVGYVSNRSTGREAGVTLIAGPDHPDPPPPGARMLRCPTRKAWLLCRVLAGPPVELDAARELQRGLVLRGPDTAAHETPTLRFDSPQDPASHGIGFLDELARELAICPPTAEDQASLAQFEPLGLVAGARPSEGLIRRGLAAAAAAGIAAGKSLIDGLAARMSQGRAGWYADTVGRYEGDPVQRALTARTGLGALTAEEARYFYVAADADGVPYRADPGFVVRIPAAAQTTDGGFWSLSVYSGTDFFPAPEAIGRFSLGDRTPGLLREPDGSVAVTVSRSTAERRLGNWLPAPEGPVLMVFRVYGAPGDDARVLRSLPLPQRLVTRS